MGELHDKMKAEFLLRGYSPNTYNGYLEPVPNVVEQYF